MATTGIWRVALGGEQLAVALGLTYGASEDIKFQKVLALFLVVVIPILFVVWQGMPSEMGGPWGAKTLVAVLLGICFLLLIQLPVAFIRAKLREARARPKPRKA